MADKKGPVHAWKLQEPPLFGPCEVCNGIAHASYVAECTRCGLRNGVGVKVPAPFDKVCLS